MCKHKCIYILAYAACKTTPKSLKHDGVWGASSPSEHIHYILDSKIIIYGKLRIIILLKTHNGHIYHICWWFTLRYALWLFTNFVSRGKSCKFQHGFNDWCLSSKIFDSSVTVGTLSCSNLLLIQCLVWTFHKTILIICMCVCATVSGFVVKLRQNAFKNNW